MEMLLKPLEARGLRAGAELSTLPGTVGFEEQGVAGVA